MVRLREVTQNEPSSFLLQMSELLEQHVVLFDEVSYGLPSSWNKGDTFLSELGIVPPICLLYYLSPE